MREINVLLFNNFFLFQRESAFEKLSLLIANLSQNFLILSYNTIKN